MKHVLFNLMTNLTLGQIVEFNNNYYKIINYNFVSIFGNRKRWYITIRNKNGIERVGKKVLKELSTKVNDFCDYNNIENALLTL